MIKFETINELTLKVTTTGNDVIFTKTGAFIAGDCSGNTLFVRLLHFVKQMS